MNELDADCDDDDDESSVARDYVIDGSFRYAALNFCNCNTIEMRSFVGTLNYTRFLATLEFADAMSRAFKHPELLSMPRAPLTPQLFTKWVYTDKGRYAELIELLKEKGYTNA